MDKETRDLLEKGKTMFSFVPTKDESQDRYAVTSGLFSTLRPLHAYQQEEDAIRHKKEKRKLQSVREARGFDDDPESTGKQPDTGSRAMSESAAMKKAANDPNAGLNPYATTGLSLPLDSEIYDVGGQRC